MKCIQAGLIEKWKKDLKLIYRKEFKEMKDQDRNTKEIEKNETINVN